MILIELFYNPFLSLILVSLFYMFFYVSILEKIYGNKGKFEIFFKKYCPHLTIPLVFTFSILHLVITVEDQIEFVLYSVILFMLLINFVNVIGNKSSKDQLNLKFYYHLSTFIIFFQIITNLDWPYGFLFLVIAIIPIALAYDFETGGKVKKLWKDFLKSLRHFKSKKPKKSNN